MQISRRTFILSGVAAAISAYGVSFLLKNNALDKSNCLLDKLIPKSMRNSYAGKEIYINNKELQDSHLVAKSLLEHVSLPQITSKKQAEKALKKAAIDEFQAQNIVDVNGWIIPKTAAFTALWSYSTARDKLCS